MSMTKRMLEEEIAVRERKEKSECDCYWNWDDKFEVLCAEHAAEAEETDREYHWSTITRN